MDGNDAKPSESADESAHGGLLRRLFRPVFRKLIEPILRANDSPKALAMGAAMGLWVSLTPTVGIQMTIVVILGTLIKANRIVAVAMTWISNPVTFVPMYYGYYKLGLLLMGVEGINHEEFNRIWSLAGGRSSWDVIVDAFRVFGEPLWVGSLVVATVFALPTYPLCLRFFEKRAARRRARLEGKLAEPAAELTEGTTP